MPALHTPTENTIMTLPHLAGIFTRKQLAETAQERLTVAGHMVTVHRMDLVKAPPDLKSGMTARRSFLPPAPAVCGLSEPGIPLQTIHGNLIKINHVKPGYSLSYL